MGIIYKNGIEYGVGNFVATRNLTQAEYDALSTAEKNDGTVYFVNDGIPTLRQEVDYVVDEGIDGIWTYRKWNSGVAECWAKFSAIKTIAADSHTAMGVGNLPDIFVTEPVISTCGGGTVSPRVYPTYANVYENGSRYALDIYMRNHGSTAFTNSTCWVHITAVGKWK